MNLLIVDDSVLIRQRLSDMLNEVLADASIAVAGNATEAYHKCNELYPDVIILDIHLPGENGIKILEKIRKKNSIVKIIILTNFPYPQYKKKCMELGADFFLDKTTEFSLVRKVVKSLLTEILESKNTQNQQS